jgi:hypothetical protein
MDYNDANEVVEPFFGVSLDVEVLPRQVR